MSDLELMRRSLRRGKRRSGKSYRLSSPIVRVSPPRPSILNSASSATWGWSRGTGRERQSLKMAQCKPLSSVFSKLGRSRTGSGSWWLVTSLASHQETNRQICVERSPASFLTANFLVVICKDCAILSQFPNPQGAKNKEFCKGGKGDVAIMEGRRQ